MKLRKPSWIFKAGRKDSELRCDALLVATGRRPQLDNLHPEAAGIA